MTTNDILAFLKTRKLAVISTCGASNHPEAALIGFGETDDFELVFGTYRTSRKYQNLKENDRVALVIGWENDNITVQLEGTAVELAESEREPYLALYHKKTPYAVKFQSHPEQTYFKIIPHWVRYSDLSRDEEVIVELEL